ncbi:hypothetical protein ACXU4B_09715 [Dyella soli]|uniref:Uncharacterized protein n=1 Tax=Dyella soli TaxID=522319 RepID=A0A4R0YXS2_9GAMM|nr:hypothetical protein [Dyella soli]TCI11210.1 hypothetical protein EZM97_20605 [Dyella soli]
MALTRAQLVDAFLSLDAELRGLETGGLSEDASQLAFERMVNKSTGTVRPQDRLWWWGQLYAAMDQQAVRVKRMAGLTHELES